MKRGSTVFLKAVILLIAILVLVAMIWFPQLEGRNANADLLRIYFQDPFLAYTYFSSISFFAGLYQAFKLLGYIEQNKTFSPIAVNTLRKMKYCAVAFAGFMAVAMLYIFVMAEDNDSPGVIVMGLVVVFASVIIATATGIFQRLLQSAIDLKSENDLTV